MKLLFPSPFRVFGWILTIPSAVLGLAILFTEGSLESQLLSEYSDEVASIGLIVGLILAGFSRQNIEDEMIRSLRLESLQLSVYINYILLIIGILLFYDFNFLQVLTYNMFTMLVVFNFRFYWLLHRVNTNDQGDL